MEFQGTFTSIPDLGGQQELITLAGRKGTDLSTSSTGFGLSYAHPIKDDAILKHKIEQVVEEVGWKEHYDLGARTDAILDPEVNILNLRRMVGETTFEKKYTNEELFDMFLLSCVSLPMTDKGKPFSFDACEPDLVKLAHQTAPSRGSGIMPLGHGQKKKDNVKQALIGVTSMINQETPSFIPYQPSVKMEAKKKVGSDGKLKPARYIFLESHVSSMIGRALSDPMLNNRNYMGPIAIGVPTNGAFGEYLAFKTSRCNQGEVDEDTLIDEQDMTNFDINIHWQTGLMFCIHWLTLVTPKSLVPWGKLPAMYMANYVFPPIQIRDTTAVMVSGLPSGHLWTSIGGSWRHLFMKFAFACSTGEKDWHELSKLMCNIYGDDFHGPLSKHSTDCVAYMTAKGMKVKQEVKKFSEAKFLKRLPKWVADQEYWTSYKDLKDVVLKIHGPAAFTVVPKLSQMLSMQRDTNDEEAFDKFAKIIEVIKKHRSADVSEEMDANRGGYLRLNTFQMVQIFQSPTAASLAKMAQLYERMMKYAF